MLWIYLHGFLGDHVGCHAVVPQSLGLHDAFHVCRPPILRSSQHTRRICHARADQHFLHLVSQHLLQQFCQWLKLCLQLLHLFLPSSSSMSNPSLVVDFNFLPSNSFNCWTAYSSIGSTMYITSRPFLRKASKKGDDD